MKFYSFFQSFGFTRNETKVILMLCTTFLLGLAIRYYNTSPRNEGTQEKGFDYSIPDSIFRQRSSALATGNSTRGVNPAFATAPKQRPESPVNINTATADELIMLPGIGPAYSKRIIAYRRENGPFTSVDDLKNVKGIGKKRLERLRQFVRVN